MKKIFALVLFLTLSAGSAFAHPGRTDAVGCHTCRTNCEDWGLATGEYHCHNAKEEPQPEAPVTSSYGANGTGYTEYEPDYEPEGSADFAAAKVSVDNEALKPSEEQAILDGMDDAEDNLEEDFQRVIEPLEDDDLDFRDDDLGDIDEDDDVMEEIEMEREEESEVDEQRSTGGSAIVPIIVIIASIWGLTRLRRK